MLRNLLSVDRDDPTLDTIWESMEQLCSQASQSSSPAEPAASAPAPGPPPPPPPAPAPPPPPGAPAAPIPPPIGPFGIKTVSTTPPEKMTKVEKSRAYKPQVKMIDKINWSKVTKAMATNDGVMWQKAAKGEMDTEVDIDPTVVEDLFAKPDAKKVEEKPKPVDEKRKTVKVRFVCVCIIVVCPSVMEDPKT